MRKQSFKSKNNSCRKFLLIPLTSMLIFSNGLVAFAAGTDYAGNAASWFLDQLFWIALVAVIVVVLTLAAKRNFTAALTTGIIGAVVVYFIRNPKTLEEIGNAIMSTVLR
nr:TcpD family membrane protein [uncultured Acetatifactor sp.]